MSLRNSPTGTSITSISLLRESVDLVVVVQVGLADDSCPLIRDDLASTRTLRVFREAALVRLVHSIGKCPNGPLRLALFTALNRGNSLNVDVPDDLSIVAGLLQIFETLLEIDELGQRLLDLAKIPARDGQKAGLEQVPNVIRAIEDISAEHLVVIRVLARDLLSPPLQDIEAECRIRLTKRLYGLVRLQQPNPNLLNNVIGLDYSRPVTGHVIGSSLDLFLELDHFLSFVPSQAIKTCK